MNPRPITVPADLSLQALVDGYLLGKNLWAVPVVDQLGRFVGLVCADKLKRIPVERWATTSVGEIMTPYAQLRRLRPEDVLAGTVAAGRAHDFTPRPVVEGDRLVGLLSHADLLRHQQIRAALAPAPPGPVDPPADPPEAPQRRGADGRLTPLAG